MLTNLCCNYVYRRKRRNSMRKNFKHWRLVTLFFSIINRRADVCYYFISLIKHDCCCLATIREWIYRIEGRIYSRAPLKWTYHCVWRYLYFRGFWYSVVGCGNVYSSKRAYKATFWDLFVAIHD